MHPGARRFLTGTPNVLGLFAAREGLKAIRELGISAIRAHSHQLTGQILSGAQARGLTIRTPLAPEERNGMVCLDFENAREAQRTLERSRVIVDWRPDCGIRVSPHFYNDSGDVERFFEVLDQTLGS